MKNDKPSELTFRAVFKTKHIQSSHFMVYMLGNIENFLLLPIDATLIEYSAKHGKLCLQDCI